jgi:hypothetical protein
VATLKVWAARPSDGRKGWVRVGASGFITSFNTYMM